MSMAMDPSGHHTCSDGVRALKDRLAGLDGNHLGTGLDEHGFAVTEPLLLKNDCAALIKAYDDTDQYRSTITMERHRFGKGEYRYYAYPLPPIVQILRDGLYCKLAPIANYWAELLDAPHRYPSSLAGFLDLCHDTGQTRPTPLILRYGPGDHNRLHQDLYGDLHFPIQIAIMLSRPGKDFSGGEFVLTEQRPRQQSRVNVVPLSQGQAVAFAVRHRPIRGTRSVYRAMLRHGVSTVNHGRRYVLGLIFHDAQA